ncbi:hypothetical protein YWIDRAFT_01007 [Streptomyces sp. SceaMP-e96]|uniref:hypothetical protein n=1 Tax=unclassified Streptomyces TaxID=2593676 RepID=UPI000823BD96|nr:MULTISPECIES: hypothetical protein [unclassified Streptomyces]MYT11786.1 hypothetical protein [Streptomyces sp. SID4951]SCK12116.1 hypothetical protein YWIDRAFT_01007 [Streptomyces sp. SceaMP-e96]
MRIRGMKLAAAALAAAAVTVPATAVPATATTAPAAAAASVKLSCSGSGGKGSAAWNWKNRNEIRSITLRGKDTKSDGRHPAVRLVWTDKKGHRGSTPWKHVRNSENRWTTPLIYDRDGIQYLEIGVRKYRGNSVDRLVCEAGRPNPRA